jgi:hypothetical protein
MFTYQTSAEILQDRRIVLTLPPETPTGKAQITVMVASECSKIAPGKLISLFGAVRSGNSRSAENDAIDADLIQAYGNSNE